TLLSIVPLLAISLAQLKSLGIHYQLEPTLVNLLAPLGKSSVELATHIVFFVDNVKIGVLGGLGLALLMFTTMSLIQKVESSLNYTWRLQHVGNMLNRVVNYLSVLLVVPALMFTAVVISASSSSSLVSNLIMHIPYLDIVVSMGGKIIPYVLIVGAFFFIYLVVPNTRVNRYSAFLGAIFAGLLWKVAAVLFAWFIDYSTNYTAIYSGFAIFLMLIIWMYLGWLIVLSGSSFAYYHQYPQRLKWRRGDFHLSVRMREQLIFQLMVNIVRHHDQRSSVSTTLDNLARYQRVPIEVIRRMVNCLKEDGLIMSSNDRPRRYLPARPPGDIRLVEILRSARRAEDNRQRGSLYCEPAVASMLEKIDSEYDSWLGEQTLAEFIKDNPE
ncbi:MAG: YihY family inner membrane protein, partial [Gammaproteobacteria bacterium]|nr:YihY family inner membrane protein [Gammaproteobacteria bacterium]